MNNQTKKSSFILFPGIAMLLGWGLRGYIGGGPFGAMIPGSFVALSISLLLGLSNRQSGIMAVFATIGIGLGGEMTYGQTIGFIRESSTFWWGLLGLSLKGAVWGLVGGTFIGIAAIRNKLSNKKIIYGLLLGVLAFYIGWKLINQPKLIYFSNRYDRPRGESWAGLLFLALSLQIYFAAILKKSDHNMPLRFAWWGFLGGGIGFGLGSLWIAHGPKIPVDQHWFGWWKFMEFSFGFLFGAALGWCSYLYREKLKKYDELFEYRNSTQKTNYLIDWVIAVVLIVAVFFLFPAIIRFLYSLFRDSNVILLALLRMIRGYTFLGILLIIVGLYSNKLCWQTAISVTFIHSVIDFNEDLLPESSLSANPVLLWLFLIISIILISFLVVKIYQNKEKLVGKMYLLLIWSCMIIASFKAIFKKQLLQPEPEIIEKFGGLFLFIVNTLGSVLLVQFIFITSAIITTIFIHRVQNRELNILNDQKSSESVP